MKRKIIIIIFLILITMTKSSKCTEVDSLSEQINQEEMNQVISEIENISNVKVDLNKIFENALTGKVSKNLIIKAIGGILGKELSESVKMVISILIVVIIHAILKSICENLGNEETGKIGYFVQLIVLISILSKVYIDILENVKTTIEEISNFAYVLLPVYMSLTAASGSITATTATQGVILIAINLITSFINHILIPILVVATVIGIVSNISDEVHMNKLAKYMKSLSIWFLCIFLTIFTCILNMESTLGQGVDNLTAKTSKTLVSTAVPIVGKILGDTVESVIGCTNVIKNAVGVMGMIAVFIIGITPIIRIGILTIFFYLISGASEIIADKKIVYVLEQMGDSCKVLLASVASLVIMLLIGFTITMKIGILT